MALTQPVLPFCCSWREMGKKHRKTPRPKTENFRATNICFCLTSLPCIITPHTQTDEVLQLKPRLKDTSKTDYHMILMIRIAAAISQHVSTISHTHTQEPLWRLFIVYKESEAHTVHKKADTHIHAFKAMLQTHLLIKKQT